jgi:hypothetical protein
VKRFAVAACGASLLALTALALAMAHPVPGQFGIGYGAALDHFLIVAALQAGVYAAAVWLVLRYRACLALILGVAILARLMVVAVPPFISNDMYRYIWDGWVQAAGINPYRYIPADPHLAFLRDSAVYPNINRANYAPTIYPPGAQISFLLASRVSRLLSIAPVLGMKLAMLCFEAGAIAAMLGVLSACGLPRARIVIYAWNPLPLWEFAGSGHVDAITVCAIACALLAAYRGRTGLAGAALGFAVVTKFLPVMLAPALWRRWDWKFAGIFGAVIALLYLPYLSAGRAIFGFLGGYATQEGIASGSGIFLLDLVGAIIPVSALGARFYLAAVAALLAALAIFLLRRPNLPIATRCLMIGGAAMFAISPHYPWYYAFLLLPACIVPAPAALYLATASLLLYLNPTHMQLLWPAAVFIPAAILAAIKPARALLSHNFFQAPSRSKLS